MSIIKKIGNVLLILLGIFFVLTGILAAKVNDPDFQNYLTQKFTSYLSKKLNTEVVIGNVSFQLFHHFELQNILIRDLHKDTLLYAGNIDVQVGLIDLLQNEFVIKDVTIDNSKLYLHRPAGSDEYTFQFIADAFQDTSASSTSGNKSNVYLSVNAITMHAMHVVLLDEVNGTLLNFQLPKTNIDVRNLDLNHSLIQLKNLSFQNADLQVTKIVPSDTSATVFPQPDTAIVHINTKPIRLLVENFEFKNSQFRYDDTTETSYNDGSFDGFHESYKNLNLQFTNASLISDTVKAKIKNISFREKSGFVVNHLEGDARLTPQIAEVKNLKIVTPNSHLGNYFAMHYTNFHAFLDYNSSVIMKTNLQSSYIAMKDIACFAPALKTVSQQVIATGTFEGTVDHIHGKNLKLHTGTVTDFEGDIDFNGLPEVSETFVDFKADKLVTDVQDLKNYIPGVKFPDQLTRLGMIDFKGSFTGFFNDFVTYGTFNTSIGQVSSDLNMKFKKGNADATYSGHLAAQDFNIGAYSGQDSLLGLVSFEATLEGSGLTIENVDAKLNGIVSKFTFNGYPYQHIDVNGEFEKKLFTGKVVVNDTNVHLNFLGVVDFNQDLPVYDFKATLTNAQLHALNFSDEEKVLSTKVDINMKGSNIDNFIGHAETDSTVFMEKNKTLILDTVALKISEDNGNKIFKVESSPLDATFSGVFALTQIPNAFLTVIDHYFPSLPLRYSTPVEKQDFDFNIQVNDASAFLNFFFPEWKGISYSNVHGHFNSAQNSIAFIGKVPSLQYLNVYVDTLHLNASAAADSFHFSTNALRMQIGDSTQVFNPVFTTNISNDTMQFHVGTAKENKNNYIDVFALLTGDTSGVRLHLLPSDLVLNRRVWHVSPDNLVTYADDRLEFFNFTLSNENRLLSISNGNKRAKATNLHVDFQDLPIVDLYNLVKVNDIDLDGVMSGSIDVLNIFNKLRLRGNTTFKDLVINGEKIAQVNASLIYKPEQDRVTMNLDVKDDRYKIRATGYVIPAKADSNLDFKVDIENMDLKLGQTFIPDIISNTSGNAYGTLYLTGNLKNPLLTGEMHIPSLTTTVNYLQTTYHMKDEKITLYEDYIELDTLRLYDQNNDLALARGQIVHDHLRDFNFNLAVTSNRFLALNTNEKDNNLFYGAAEVGGLIQFIGPLNNMEIRANVKSGRGTSISIPVDYTTSVSDQSFIRFRKKGILETGGLFMEDLTQGLTLNFDLEMTPEAQIQIIFDQKAGDIVRGTGSGNIRLEIDTRGEFNMYGTYTIDKGDYLFTELNFFNKYFTIERGGTVSFSGNPYDALINISAIYETRASAADLVAGTTITLSDQDRKELEQRLPVDVYLKLTGSLLLPDIAFDIKFPDINSISSTAYQELEKVKQDENELNKQVFGLLVLGRFLPEASGLGDQSVATDVNNSVSEFLLNQLSYWTSQINKDVDFRFDYSSYESSLNSTNPNDITKRNELQAAVTYRFFNDRLALEAGGNLDFGGQPQSSGSSSSSNFAGDFALDYEITPDGRIVAQAFSKSQYDVVDERYKTKNGVALSFQKEFDKLKDLFSKNPDKKKKASQ